MVALYTFREHTIVSGSAQFKIKVIETPLNNIKSETIRKPMFQTSYFGINGGFFDSDDYTSPPTRGDSIAWSYEDQGTGKNYNYNGSPTNQKSRKTLVVYQEGNFFFGATMYAKNVTEVRNKYPEAREIIGGFGLESSEWDWKAYNGPSNRTFMAFDGNVSKRIGYLIIAPALINVPAIKIALSQIGLRHEDAIVLDGSGSTAMKIPEYYYNGDGRYIFNMIRLKRLQR